MKIAFGGKMGVGKSTAAQYLHKKIPHSQIVSFSEPIYNILHHAQNITNQTLQKDRQFLQFIGTEWGRNIDPQIWINILLQKTVEPYNYFLSDIRFDNELQSLKENGWICILIEKENNPDCQFSQHSSETSIDHITRDKWDFIINNNFTKQNLYFLLDNILDHLKKI